MPETSCFGALNTADLLTAAGDFVENHDAIESPAVAEALIAALAWRLKGAEEWIASRTRSLEGPAGA